MEERTSLHCVNCGNTWEPAERQRAGEQALAEIVCPVCQYPISTAEEGRASAITVNDLESQLSTLIGAAFADGLEPQDIVKVLQDELEFAAEMAHAGRRLFIQIVDLGPQEAEIHASPVRDRSTILRSRAAGR
jgi:hypothetical protein